MTKRRFYKLIKRIIYLPRGIDLLKYGTNKFYGAFLSVFNKTRVAYPSTINIEVTNICNLKCITCGREYDYGRQMDKGYINFDNFKKLIDEAYPYIDSVGLTGLGETFLYKDIIKAAEYIRDKSKGIIISVSINAHLDNSPEIAAKLINKIDTIQISIDGLNEVYNSVRIKGDFSKFLKNTRQIIEYAKDSDTDVTFNMVVLKENYKQMTDMIRFAHQEGVKFVNFTPMNLVSITNLDESYYELFETEEFNEELKRASKEVKKYSELEFTFPNFSKKDKFEKCHYPWGYFYITWDGYMPPCCAKPFPKELNFGNVFQDGLLNTLNSKKFQNFRKIWLNKEYPEFCDKCY